MRIYCPNSLCIDSRGRRTVLAEVVADCYVMRHRGRETVSREVVSIKCDRCGAIWTQKALCIPPHESQ